MWSYSKNPVLQGAIDQKKPERDRQAVLAKAAALKLQRSRDASQAMREIEEARLATKAKTERLRAARLAREAEAALAQAANANGAAASDTKRAAAAKKKARPKTRAATPAARAVSKK